MIQSKQIHLYSSKLNLTWYAAVFDIDSQSKEGQRKQVFF